MNCSSWLPNTEVIAGGDHEPSFIITYSFPLNGSISIRSFLSQATGTFRVSLDDQLPEDTSSIEVIAGGLVGPGIRDAAACLSTESGGYNLSLKAKGPSAESATYSISLRLPSRALSYPGLVTDLPRFIQSFDELSRRFDFIAVGGVKSDVSSVSLFAKFLSVRTSDGSIDGHFSADKRLDISGDLKPITITSTICDDGSGFGALARISSSGSPINAKLTLCEAIQKPIPNAEDEHYGRYRLYVANSDSPISLQVEHAVPTQDSSLYLNVTNTEIFSRGTAHIMVSLGSEFEGNFDVRATGTGTTPVSVQSEDATDDQGGIRYMEIERVENDKRSMSGKVFWDSPAPPLDQRGSEIYISTTGDGEASLLFLGD